MTQRRKPCILVFSRAMLGWQSKGKGDRMNCKEAKKNIMPYIRDTLDVEALEDFLAHIAGCESCREELEIYFIIEKGLVEMEENKGEANISRVLKETIAASYERISRGHALQIVGYVVNTLVLMALLLSLLLQLRIWWQEGFFL